MTFAQFWIQYDSDQDGGPTVGPAASNQGIQYLSKILDIYDKYWQLLSSFAKKLEQHFLQKWRHV